MHNYDVDVKELTEKVDRLETVVKGLLLELMASKLCRPYNGWTIGANLRVAFEGLIKKLKK